MEDRVQQVLDGELPREALTPPEQAELLDMERGIRAILHTVPRQSAPDLAPAIMSRIAQGDTQRSAVQAPQADRSRPAALAALATAAAWVRAGAAWVWQPRRVSFALRPAYGAVAVAALALTLVLGGRSQVQPVEHQVLTQFLLNAPDAQQVMLAGDFTNWQPAHTLTQTEPGVWSVVVPMTPGVHSYAFVVDGDRWVPDPNAPAVNDGFGGLNSRLAVLAPDVAGS